MNIKIVGKKLNRGIILAILAIIAFIIYVVISTSSIKKEKPVIEQMIKDMITENCELMLTPEALRGKKTLTDAERQSLDDSVTKFLNDNWTTYSGTSNDQFAYYTKRSEFSSDLRNYITNPLPNGYIYDAAVSDPDINIFSLGDNFALARIDNLSLTLYSSGYARAYFAGESYYLGLDDSVWLYENDQGVFFSTPDGEYSADEFYEMNKDFPTNKTKTSLTLSQTIVLKKEDGQWKVMAITGYGWTDSSHIVDDEPEETQN